MKGNLMVIEHTPLTREQLYYLGEDLSPLLVSQRKQGGATLSYMEAWQIKATLIRVFGYGGFSADVVESKVLRMQQDVPAFDWVGPSGNRTKKPKVDENGQPVFNWSVTAQSTVRLTIHQTGATYTETAAASQVGPDVGEVTDFAIKTSESDALKRAAIYLGTQFGLSLYNNGGTSDVIGAVWAPDQIGQRDAYIQEMIARQQAQQAQQPAPRVQADSHMAALAQGLKVDSRDGADA
jgi:recombination DNA repair RAD52 pathway protein